MSVDAITNTQFSFREKAEQRKEKNVIQKCVCCLNLVLLGERRRGDSEQRYCRREVWGCETRKL